MTVRTPRGAPWFLLALVGAVVGAIGLGWGHALVTVAGAATEVVFVAYFARHAAFTMTALRGVPADLSVPALDPGFRPPVSILVACRDEAAVVPGLVAALDALEVPSDDVEWVLVDDGSTDATGELLDAAAVARPWVRVVHRPVGAGGGKSGALNTALAVARGEVVVVFDADHRPRPDAVRRLVRHLVDPAVAAVQGRCEIRNAEASLVARLVAVDYHAGYLVDEYARQALASAPACGGSNFAVRTSVLRELGGWNERTVTEDTDLTLRLRCAGARIRFDVGARDDEEAVTDLRGFWRQRYRWARGHQQVCRDQRRAVWESRRLTGWERLETLLFLHAYHVPVLSALGMVVLACWVGGVVTPAATVQIPVLWTVLFLGPLLQLGGGLLLAGARRRDVWLLVAFLPLYLVSAACGTKAWFDGVAGRRYDWVKTARAADVADTVVLP